MSSRLASVGPTRQNDVPRSVWNALLLRWSLFGWGVWCKHPPCSAPLDLEADPPRRLWVRRDR